MQDSKEQPRYNKPVQHALSLIHGTWEKVSLMDEIPPNMFPECTGLSVSYSLRYERNSVALLLILVPYTELVLNKLNPWIPKYLSPCYSTHATGTTIISHWYYAPSLESTTISGTYRVLSISVEWTNQLKTENFTTEKEDQLMQKQRRIVLFFVSTRINGFTDTLVRKEVRTC